MLAHVICCFNITVMTCNSTVYSSISKICCFNITVMTCNSTVYSSISETKILRLISYNNIIN